MGLYGEMVTEILTGKQHKLSDEGSYYLTRTPTVGSGVNSTAANNAYSDTQPYIVISNNNPALGKCIYLDYIKLTCVTPGTNGTNLLYAMRIDSTLRYSSGSVAGGAGTGMTAILQGPTPTNTAAAPASSALVYVGAITATTGSPNARTLGSGILRTAIAVASDTYLFNFAGIDQMIDGVLVSGTAIAQRSIPHPPVCIAPGGSFLLHLWAGSQSGAAAYEVEIGHVER
jgi:hypothetical protein